MAHIYRLIFLVLLCFSPFASATEYTAYSKSCGWFRTSEQAQKDACMTTSNSFFPAGWFLASTTTTEHSTPSSFLPLVNFFSCKIGDAYHNGKCTTSCPEGTLKIDGQCKAPLSDLGKCAAWNNEFNSMPDSERPTDADGFRSVEPSRVCFRPYDDPFKPVNPLTPSPGKGCVMKFERDMAFGDGNGGWTSRGKYSTVTPEVCDWDKEKDGSDTPKEDACPAGYEKSKYADVCIPVEKNDTDCPEGYEPSQYVKGICIPKEKKPDPFDPDPTNPKGPGPYDPKPDGSCDPGYVRDGASCYKDPKPKQPDPTDPKQPGPGDTCPEGYSKNASGMCTKDTFTPGPGIPCPTGYSKNASGACVKDAPPSCPPGEQRNADGLCVPKPCEPDPKWPEKCTACEKDALNPNVCKDDPGKCVPDPAIPDKCTGKDDGEEGSFGGNCQAGFSCKGDVIQCAIAKEQHVMNCKLLKEDDDPSSVVNKAINGTDDFNMDKLKSKAESISVGSFDRSGFGWSNSCPADVSIPINFGGSSGEFSIPFSRICGVLGILSAVGVGITLLGSMIWVLGGKNNRG